MNQFRINLVMKAYDKLDVTGDGTVNIDDIRQAYDPSRHPEVRNGKKQPDEVLFEFLDQFQMHHNLMEGVKGDKEVTREEFIEYYNNISCNIDSDAHFDLLITNAWNLDNKNNYDNMPYAGSSQKVTAVKARDAWRHDHHRTLWGDHPTAPIAKKFASDWTTNTRQMGQGSIDQFTAPPAGTGTFPPNAQTPGSVAW